MQTDEQEQEQGQERVEVEVQEKVQSQPTPVVNRVAQIISDIFSPLLLPTYSLILIMAITPLSALPLRTQLLSVLAIAFITAFIPTATIFTLIRMGKVSDNSISDRRQRSLPLIVVTLCYLASASYMLYVHAPEWLILFFVGAAVSSVLALIITHWWKISAHTISIGGIAGMLGWLTFNSVSNNITAMVWLTIAIILGGLIGSSRIILNRHTTGQVFAGLILGAGAVLATVSSIIYFLSRI
jgi:membrane-associated phospholipid phosphatase